MRFQVLSHAGLLVEACGRSLVCDPWLVGSTYWRSWWNYPPVDRELVRSLRPDYVYLTHVHWDHFTGPSLRLFDRATPIVIPREPAGRMRRDLGRMSFPNVVELKHGESLEIAAGFRITSYHFNLFTDSALVIEADGKTLFNANDAKLMGGPLRQLLKRHPRIDFVLRSHSSANSRILYEVIDAPETPVDDRDRYVDDFAHFTRATGARWAIPFASNHCHLHPEVYRFNEYVVTPMEVKRHFEADGIASPALQIMVSGDSWSSEHGFEIADRDWFEKREEHLRAYQQQNRSRIEATDRLEELTGLRWQRIAKYFDVVSAAMPWPLRHMFRGTPVLYVLTAGANQSLVEVDFWSRQARLIDAYSDATHPVQIHTQTAIFRHCIGNDLFSHLAISKRVRYRATRDKIRLLKLLGLFYNFYEYEMLPLRRIEPARFVGAWARRWRELLLYSRIALDFGLGRGFSFQRHLPAPPPRRWDCAAGQSIRGQDSRCRPGVRWCSTLSSSATSAPIVTRGESCRRSPGTCRSRPPSGPLAPRPSR